MKKLLSTLLLLACLCAPAQTFVVNTLNLTGPFTNSGLASAGSFFVFADANGRLWISPWQTNQWLWLTNSSGAGLGYSNAYSPLRIYGTLTVANLNGTVGSLTNGGFLNPIFTNAVNYGNPFDSPGSAAQSLQVGSTALATGTSSAAVGNGAQATAFHAAAFGNVAFATVDQATALGQHAWALDTNATAVGSHTSVAAGHTNSTALGYGATTTAANQVMIGAAAGGGVPAISAIVNNYLSVLGGETIANGVTNLWLTGTNTLLAGSDVAFTRSALSTLANGNNAAVPVGTNVFVEVSGPSGAFTINGIAGQPNRDGKLLMLKNATGQTMTIANQSGTDPTPGNRILTGFSADQSYTNNPGMVTLIYDGNAARWIVVSHN